jgi:hypothetical protein
MKKAMIKSGIITGALMVTFTLASIQKIVAQSKNENPVEFKYMGKTNNQPVFLLNLHNSEANEFVITLTDENGTVLYDDKVAGKDVSRKYRLDLDEIDASEIRFQIRNKKDKSINYFTVKRNVSFIDEWAMK